MTRTLFAIFAFIAFMLGNFVWFIATWDADKEEPVSRFSGPETGSEVHAITTLPSSAMMRIGAST